MLLERDGEDDKLKSMRASTLEEVRNKLRTGWKYDDDILNQYFQSCYLNWKVYQGDRTSKQVIKLQALYKQAVYGDNTLAPPAKLESGDGLKWQAWRQLYGVSSQMAKRRFITYLSEVNPLLIDVMPDERPPPGFPLDRDGIPICAKCNTMIGCLRPLLDQNKASLKDQLYNNEELHEPSVFNKWLSNAMANHRCIWGIHKSIARADAKQFMAWFDRTENRGFCPYEPIAIKDIVHGLVQHHHEITYDLMKHKEEVEAEDYNKQAVKTLKLKAVYEELAGTEFVFFMPCERHIDVCDLRRVADGGKNHTHRVQIDPPISIDNNTMEESIALRVQCQKLGLNPTTGVVTDLTQRCSIYRKRIAEYYESRQKSKDAKVRNDTRSDVHSAQKKQVKELARLMLARQCSEACDMNFTADAVSIVRRGGHPDNESLRGITPLLSCMINDSPLELIEALIVKLKANLNYVNRHGLTALSMACRLNSSKLVHVLMRNGASAITRDNIIGFNALHWCVIHGNEDMVTVMVEYLKEGVGDSLRVTRFLDALSLDGETPLMVAARTRNAIMCHSLTTLGADPNIRNNKGRTAAYLARTANWSEIADWLEKKAGVGMSKMETFSDLQFEKQQRFGLIKVKDLIQLFGREYLHLVQNRIGLHPIGCPFVARSMIIERGVKAREEQKLFVDHHVQYVLQREAEPYTRERQRSVRSNHAVDESILTADDRSKAPDDDAEKQRNHLLAMHDAVNQMVALLRKGTANPNAESLDKPLAFTPLMCAVVLSDVRSVKLMVREGANPDHPNKDGTTAVMLAAQLQNVEMLMQLLLIRPQDALKYLNSVDNQGHTALAYASSLPLPSIMERDDVDILMSGDVDGPRPLSSAQLISIVLAGGLSELHDVFENAQQSSTPQAVDTHYKVQHLLEMFGLSRVKSIRHIHDTVKSSAMRLLSERGPSTHSSIMSVVDGDHKGQRQEEVVVSSSASATERPRCPLCTLVIPCQHFFSEDLLKQFMNKKIELKLAKEIAEDEAYYESLAADEAAAAKKKKKAYVSDRKFKAKSRSEAILDEAQIGDRRTDRSLTLINAYRPREQQLMREKGESLQLLVSEDEDEEDEDEEDIAIKDTTPALDDNDHSQPLQQDKTIAAQLQRVESFHSASTGISELTAVTFDSALRDREDSDGQDQGGDSCMRLLQISVEEVKSDAVLALAAEESQQISSSSTSDARMVTVPRLKSSLKVLLDVGDVDSASNAVALINEKKKKKRVKFYLPTTDSAGETGADSSDKMVDDDDMNHGATLIADDVSLFSDSTQPMETTMKPNSVLITLPVKSDTSPSGGMASERSSSGLAEASAVQSSSTEPSASAEVEGSALVRAGPLEQQSRSDPAASAKPALTNPIPSHQRKVFMFTKASMDRHGEVDGLIKASSSGSLKRKVIAGHAQKRRPVTVQVSGWIFVSLADIKSEVHLLDSIELSLDNWGTILELLREKFMDDFLSLIQLEPVVSIKTWRPLGPRCSVCRVGYVRFRSSIQMFRDDPGAFERVHPSSAGDTIIEQRNRMSLDAGLCLPCALKKELFAQSRQFFPPSYSTQLEHVSWPFVHRSGRRLGSRNKRASAADTDDSRSKAEIDSIGKEVDCDEEELMDEGDEEDSVVSSISGNSFLNSSALFYNEDLADDDGGGGGDDDDPMEASPVKSKQLLELDQQEQWEREHDPLYYSRLLIAPPVEESSKSSSSVSRLTESEAVRFKAKYGPKQGEPVIAARKSAAPEDGSKSTTTRASTVTAIDPTKKPKELALIPFLVAKGHYEEAERSLRIALGKHAVDEGEGLKILITLLKLQCEMYKSMGLWVLAASIYLDCIDLTASLMGFNDPDTYSCIVLLVSCLRKMQSVHLAGKYIKCLCQHFERDSLKSFKKDIIKTIKERDEVNVKEYLTLNKIWVDKLKPAIPSNNPLQRRFQSVVGMGGFYSLLTAQDGYSVVGRSAFYHYCTGIDSKTLGPFARYVELCFRLRSCDEPQVYRYLTQYMVQRLLAKRLVKESELARIYRSLTTREHVMLVVDFLKYGQHPTVEVFDAALEHVLVRLLPLYRVFLLFDPAGCMLRETSTDLIAEAYDVSATIIQTAYRRVLARRQLLQRRTVRQQQVALLSSNKPRKMRRSIIPF